MVRSWDRKSSVHIYVAIEVSRICARTPSGVYKITIAAFISGSCCPGHLPDHHTLCRLQGADSRSAYLVIPSAFVYPPPYARAPSQDLYSYSRTRDGVPREAFYV